MAPDNDDMQDDDLGEGGTGMNEDAAMEGESAGTAGGGGRLRKTSRAGARKSSARGGARKSSTRSRKAAGGARKSVGGSRKSSRGGSRKSSAGSRKSSRSRGGRKGGSRKR